MLFCKTAASSSLAIKPMDACALTHSLAPTCQGCLVCASSDAHLLLYKQAQSRGVHQALCHVGVEAQGVVNGKPTSSNLMLVCAIGEARGGEDRPS